MNTPLIVGNWKMNTSLEEATTLAASIAQTVNNAGASVVVGICPPYPWIVPVGDIVRGSSLRMGAQDCASTESGAHTGDVSAAMLASCCSFTLIGHSERRSNHQETDDIVRQKLNRALDAGLDVILCVGESSAQRGAGEASNVVQHQLGAALEGFESSRLTSLTIAYEPVWAIGTGVAATEDDAAQMSTVIRHNLSERFESTSDSVRILYGGSANDRNAPAFLAANNVDGLLVGGASLSSDTFGSMIRCAANGA